MKISRRSFLSSAGAGTVSLSLGGLMSATSCNQATESKNNSCENDSQALFIGDYIAIAQTQYGKVQGYIMNGVYTFLGIRYGADTSGKNRFMPPQKPEPWEGIQPAVFYGNTAPQRMENRFPNNYGTFVDHWNYYDVSEDCLFLNVWTPGVADGKKRPVLVWMHGGGFTNGNAIEQDGYHGENLSKYGDVVFCSLNHRLGPIGYSDLSALGDKYKDSGNVGMLDIIAALEWVQHNIANFGGDPSNVTIMGQSGGGSKVCTVAAMPAAKNLIHKAVPLSGSTVEASNQEITRQIGTYILKEAGLSPGQADKLQEIPWREYIDIADRACTKCLNDLGSNLRRTFGPVADGIHIPKGTFYSSANSANSPQVPMLLCTTFHEWNPTRGDGSFENMTLADVVEKIKPQQGEKAQAIVDAYAKSFPDARPVDLWVMILSSRVQVVKTANAKLEQNQPVYMAWFGWCPPLFNNRMRAFHCLDICFWFRNTDRMVTHTGGGSTPRKLANKMSDALLSFMRTGNPNGSELPQWPEYTKEKGEVMILDNQCFVENDPDREARKTLES
ncbi:MAG: carboxylesterase family protein [Tannerellaceae bacterium]|nr:carboxylesterase family protein [Tannerellaceae bacterium]